MAQKIVKVFISLLFLAVTAVAALFAIKTFLPGSSDTEKYGVKPIDEIEAIEEQPVRDRRLDQAEAKYGVVPVHRTVPVRPSDMVTKYGVFPPVRPVREDMTDKYGVAPIYPPISEQDSQK